MDYSKDFKHVHFIGIGGIGMSAVAEVMLERGFVISGSDLNESDHSAARRSGSYNFLWTEGGKHHR